jgi:hypothetical protein
MNHLILEKKVIDFRNNCGIGTEDSIRLKSLLYKLNVLTVFKPLSSNFSGMAVKVSDGLDVKRFILINSNKTLGHQHFTICHELYHLFVQSNFTSMVCTTGEFKKGDKEEYNADIFAAKLLMPEQGIKGLIPDEELTKDKISLKTILKIEQYFSCSRSSLLYRLKNLGLISEKIAKPYYHNIQRSAIEFGYTIDLYKDGNHNQVVGDYGTIAHELFDLERISESHYFSLLLDLGMNVKDIENLNNGE